MIDQRFQIAFDQYLVLKAQLAAGHISREQFDSALKQLTILDARGRYWMIGPDTGKWYVHDGHTWVEAQPGASFHYPPAAPFVQAAPQKGPSSTALFAVVGIAFGIFFIGVIALFFASSQGLVKIGQSSPPNTPTTAYVPISKIESSPTAAVIIVTATPPPPTTVPLPSQTPVVIVVTATPVPATISPTPLPTLPPPTTTTIPTATPSPTISSAGLVAQADKLTFQSKFDDAATLYQRAIELDGQNAVAYAHWARLLDYQGHLEMRDNLLFQAVNKSQTASQLAPNDPEILTWMARAYAWSEIHDKALAFAQKAAQLAPNSAETYAVLAEVELGILALADAERDALKAVQLNPNSGEAHYILGLVLKARKQTVSAVAELERAAQLDPDLALRHGEMGAMYRSGGNLGQAVVALERSIALYPRAARAHAVLGVVYRDQKLYEKSIQSLNTAIQINDRVADLYFELGQSYLAAGQIGAAIDAARRGGAIEPNNQNYMTLLEAISRAQGTPAPTVAKPASPTPAAPPGIYVTAIQTDPQEVKHGQMPTFQVTFLNTLGIPADYIWFVKLYEPEKKQSFGETAKSANSIPPGNNLFSTFSNWKATGATPCRPFIARVFYIGPNNAAIEFPKAGGDSFWHYFSVCQ